MFSLTSFVRNEDQINLDVSSPSASNKYGTTPRIVNNPALISQGAQGQARSRLGMNQALINSMSSSSAHRRAVSPSNLSRSEKVNEIIQQRKQRMLSMSGER